MELKNKNKDKEREGGGRERKRKRESKTQLNNSIYCYYHNIILIEIYEILR